MRIGITYDLRDDYLRAGFDAESAAEFDCEDTVAAIAAALRAQGHETERVGHVRALADRLSQGDRWDLVFNIAEGLSGFGREAQVPALLEAFEVPYTFSGPLTLSLALHKGMAKRIVRDIGIPTPAFVVVETLPDIESCDLPFPLFVKPVAEGTSKGISAASKVLDRAQLRATCERLLERFRQPVLVEAYLPGREFTVGIIGTGAEATAIGVLEVLLGGQAEPEIYSYVNKQDYAARVGYRLAEGPIARQAAETALAAWRGLGCRDGGRVDLRCDTAGRPSFIEANPLAGLHPEHSDIVILARLQGVTYGELIERIVDSARRRSTDSDGPQLSAPGAYGSAGLAAGAG